MKVQPLSRRQILSKTMYRIPRVNQLKREILNSLHYLTWMVLKHQHCIGGQSRQATLRWMMKIKQQSATLCLELSRNLELDLMRNLRENSVSRWSRTASSITRKKKRESSRRKRNFRRSWPRGAMLFKSLCVTALRAMSLRRLLEELLWSGKAPLNPSI